MNGAISVAVNVEKTVQYDYGEPDSEDTAKGFVADGEIGAVPTLGTAPNPRSGSRRGLRISDA